MKTLEEDEEQEDAALFLGTANLENCPLVSKAMWTPVYGVELLWRELGCLCIALKMACGGQIILECLKNTRTWGMLGRVWEMFAWDFQCLMCCVQDSRLIFCSRRRKQVAFIDSLFNVGQISRCQFFSIHVFCHSLSNRLLSNWRVVMEKKNKNELQSFLPLIPLPSLTFQPQKWGSRAVFRETLWFGCQSPDL